MSPKLFIAIPTYEPSPEHLREALDSLLAQSEQDWIALIHDDASTQDVKTIVEPYLQNDRISFVRNPNRRGIGGNWNACVKVAETPFIQYLFQDDIWKPDYLHNALSIAENDESLCMVATDHEYLFEGDIENRDDYQSVINKRSDITAGKHEGPEFLKEWLQAGLHPNLIGEPSFVLLRTNLVGRFSEDMPQFLDVEKWTHMLRSGHWYHNTTNGGSFRVHPKGASTQNNQSGTGIYDRFRCIDSLCNIAGDIGITAKRSRSAVLEEMIGKFFARVKSKKGVTTKGSGALKRFCMRHPLVMTGAIWRCVFMKEK